MHENTLFLHESPEILFLHGGIYHAKKGQDFPPHVHTNWELVYYLSGSPRCPIGERIYDVVPGTLLITPPGVSHSETARTAYSCLYIELQASCHYPWQMCYRDDSILQLEQTCRALLTESHFAETASQEQVGESFVMTQLLLRRLLILLARLDRDSVRPASRSEQLVTCAERMICESYSDQRIGVEQIARLCDVSISTLRAAFHTTRGVSPRDALVNYRLRQALALLYTSDLTVEAIANRCGFDSASHVSRRVKGATGFAPSVSRSRLEPGG